MKFTPLNLQGAYIIDIEPHIDQRGFFARFYCEREFEALGLCTHFVQHDISYNEKKGTLRGMHYQTEPFWETKVISCPKGTIYDVILDIRENSPTFGKWEAIELSGENNRAIYLPVGFAHGFQSLTDHSLVCYLMGAFYEAAAGRTIRWDDPRFGIKWPLPNPIMSDKDKNA